MASHIYDRRVTDSEFLQRVRRHAPSSLLPLVAQFAAIYAAPGSWLNSPYKKLTPWNLAEVTRVSLLYGNEYRQPATSNDVMRCCAAYTGMSDPDLHKGTLDGFAKFMLRLSGEQLSYGLPVFNELARSIALFEQTVPNGSLEALVGDWAQELLGCSITEYVGVGFLFYAGALRNGGIFVYAWLGQSNFEPVVCEVAADTIKQVAKNHFIADIEGFRNMQLPRSPRHPDTRRYTFNPLQARPVIKDLVDHLLIPVPGMLVKKVSPLGLYYTGTLRWGDKFSRDVGRLFEAYVGHNLELMHGALVYPAITYGRDKRESTDWIAVFDGVTLLVEVKSTRPTENVRIGNDSAGKDLQKRLTKAYKQIDATAKLIQDRHADFAAIPAGNSIVGLVVTMEPFHVINATPYRNLLPPSDIPIRVCDASELERLVTVEDVTVGQLLLAYVQDLGKVDWSVGSALQGYFFRRNAVLDKAWDALPWKQAGAEELAS